MGLATALTTPDATFDRDLPVMIAMCKSMKVNAQRAQQVSDAENQQIQQMTQQMAQQSQQQLQANARQFQQDQDTRFRIGQEQHDAQMEGYAQHNQQWQSDELQKQRNAADFIETIKGTRTVVDTQTGASGAVELTSVNGVVNQLNQDALDPNRYVQIPLRDEMYPLPPAGAGK
jgi:ATP-dependent 26S proteasome regulatory subunit